MSQSIQPDDFDPLGRFILDGFDHCRPFSSFLPGIVGVHGIPMWAFYVNRGQGLCSFGVRDKDHPILEFQSANRAYQVTSIMGFRTFVNGVKQGQRWAYEAFAPWEAQQVQRKMFIGMNEFEIQEVNLITGCQVNVLYFLLPNLPFAGLVRQLRIKNLGQQRLDLEVLDGLPVIVPFGVNNDLLKQMGRTIEAWMRVDNLEERLPYYRLKATPGDTTDVHTIQAGNFALSFTGRMHHPAVADPKVVFGMDTGFSKAHHFHAHGLEAVLSADQTVEGRALGAFFGAAFDLASGESQSMTSIYGYSDTQALIEDFYRDVLDEQVVVQKLAEARKIACDLTDSVDTHSGFSPFDGFCRQTFLDNVMRGGYPVVLGEEAIYHVYSRKHGDIERDYNDFVLPPTFYSQGNGNYRDINQNRRNDVFFVPQAGAFNLWLFMSLIQADGYNPLVIAGVNFSLPHDLAPDLLGFASQGEALSRLFKENFSPGELFAAAREAGLSIPVEEFLQRVISNSDLRIQAEHGEGFWIDHWTYNLDLIETYLAVFPDRREDLLFHSMQLPFYDNDHIVQARTERFVLVEGQPRQMHAVVEDPEKTALIATRRQQPHWARTDQGQGEIFYLPLVSKLALLALIKFATRDPHGMGIQMEAGKPGWYDALNGLPGLFGSSMPETYELLRLVQFLGKLFEDFPQALVLPLEAQVLWHAIGSMPEFHSGSLDYWEHLTSALERYRSSVRLGFDGATHSLDPSGLFETMQRHLEQGISRAQSFNAVLPPTYFKFSVTDYALLAGKDASGHPRIAVRGFKPDPLPPFLEGPVRQMKISSRQEAQALAHSVKNSGLYDQELRLYKVNASLLGESHAIGRARAFTPGWLENESIWMHMSFKYLLELLTSQLFEEFFEAFRDHLPAFMDPEVYGRSPLENCSFIVSSAHPDPTLHGNGFVARLSGSTAEFLSMWRVMSVGQAPFRVEAGELVLQIDPALPGWLFTDNGTFTFRFLGQCEVVLINPLRRDTFAKGFKINRINLYQGAQVITFHQGVIPSPYAHRVRAGEFTRIECYFPA